ncbi:putative neutral sphingomyelinase isoform X1 [Varroa jacobsoni]|uniref:putative neutral sphingomyelinase isoform X1 n=2 Tax=Varroa jacobsoni TaxID=62625 RepID=UPI000BF531BD|nr:putative neutral sphingomyelinase isoform X1 [Varroa jacobsoni]XP_022690716.1 putative neutral sphingomyelinase isoform X1 [Varroa jacobsoni]XP_022690717.1 putative neutral sphingomyelinase isoform X1 [Varroa jacobsoni]XP_022690718.1 putative neutral sphingomyelinase isoform X1 [Varroa jacobsoni]XP_022690720.1 putative neutral sphingomyelinase isoform X1 [Varroa jacobsoni]XP_022690721.1 putative neutral sphingomyelinase isoform X1 [Varroa jacobsoni]XP_022690722.1 putative neutral sphingomy
MHSSLLKDGDGDSFSDTVDLFGGTHTQKFGAAAANRASQEEMLTKVKVLSLNLWGLVFVSKHRRDRVDALAEQLAFRETDFDYVFLQEVWSESDYRKICEATKLVLPYTHYFYSGVTGSGVCILSKWPIIDIFAYKYSLNGYAHKFYHGDWFGGKVVGMAKVQHRDMIANLYVTHLHAEYDRLQDIYLYHRVSQAFEFSQFVSHTSLGSCDYAIIAGDFNTQPMDLPYQVILYNSRLRDSFEEKEHYFGESSIGATCGHPANSFTNKADLKTNPNGQRIDYIMYSNGTDRVSVSCEKYASPVWKTQSGFTVSDHEPVVAVLRIVKRLDVDSNMDFCSDPMVFVNFLNDDRYNLRITCLENSVRLMDKTLATLRTSRMFFIGIACLLAVLLIASTPIDLYVEHSTYLILLHMLRVALTLGIGFCLLMGFFWNSMERSSIISSKQAMDSLLNFLHAQSSAAEKRQKGQETTGNFTDIEQTTTTTTDEI